MALVCRITVSTTKGVDSWPSRFESGGAATIDPIRSASADKINELAFRPR